MNFQVDSAEPTPPTNHGYSLTPEDIREFQEIVREETGVELPAEQAWDRAIELVSLVRMLVSPFPEDRKD